MKVSVRVIDKGLIKIKKRLADLSKNPSYVKIGLLGDGSKNRRADGPLTNAQLGLIHEFGTSRIPARPFIQPSFEKGKPTYLKMLEAGIKKDIHSEGSRERTLEMIGMKASADMKAFVTGGAEIQPTNAPSTKRRKEAKRASGNAADVRTLVDTGRMVGSITYAVVKKGK